ncbi:hypothetical protein HG440_001675 [Candidatus Saccharibacteria bacterium]|nr:hypothetical protein [Candidatus Saccharibacteria bacterium]
MYAYDIEAATRELSLSNLAKHVAFMDFIQGGDSPEYVRKYADMLGERLENKIELCGVPMRHFKQHCNSRDTVHLMMSRLGEDEIIHAPAVQEILREHARCYVWSMLVVTWREYLRQVARVVADGAAVPVITQAAQSPSKLFFISTHQGLLVQAQCGQNAIDKIQAEYSLPLNPFLAERFGELVELVERETANVLEEGTAAVTADPTEEGGIVTVTLSLT